MIPGDVCRECHEDINETYECGSGNHTIWREVTPRLVDVTRPPLSITTAQLRVLKSRVDKELKFRKELMKRKLEEVEI